MEKSFSISPRVLAHLGEDLIKNESIALLELVKNSYDACATKCIVKFNTKKNLETSEYNLIEIIIEDNGFGMDIDVIEKIWLDVGTDYKLKNLKPNLCNRIPLGEKGIGRLTIHKLGEKIELTSKKENSKEVKLTIDWSNLNKVKRIEDFKIKVIENSVPSVFKKNNGTRIEIRKLKTKWGKKQIRDVYRALTSLNSPFGETNENFSVKIEGEKEFFEGLPTFEDIKDSALYYGKCKMNGDRIVEFKYEFKPWDTLSKIDKGRIKTTNQLPPNELFIVDTSKYHNRINLDNFKIGPIEFDVIIFEKDAQIFNYVNAEKTSIITYLNANGGIRVFRDGIRVYDYGERDNDWLGIDIKRVSRVGGRVSNNIILGSVKINRKDSTNLKEKTNREGFIENKSYNVFVDAVNYALSLIVKERNSDKQKLTTLYKKHKIVEPVLSDLDEVIRIVEDEIDKNETKNEILKYLNRIGEQYKEVKEILIKSANAGLNLSVVIHEIEKLIAALTGSIERRELKKAENISRMLEKIIRGYMAMIKKSSIKKTRLAEIVEEALNNYEFRFSDHKIEIISNYKQNSLYASLAKAESISVLTNLLDNSIYWLSYARIENRKISVYITDQIKGYNSIIVSDNGPGFNIPTDVAIEPFITGKPHNIGSGLGLHIANEMMNAMKGKLFFLDEYDDEFPEDIRKHKINQAIIALCFRKEMSKEKKV